MLTVANDSQEYSEMGHAINIWGSQEGEKKSGIFLSSNEDRKCHLLYLQAFVTTEKHYCKGMSAFLLMKNLN